MLVKASKISNQIIKNYHNLKVNYSSISNIYYRYWTTFLYSLMFYHHASIIIVFQKRNTFKLFKKLN